MELVKIKIDGQEVEVPKDTTVLEAAKKINKIIPTFCYHEKLPIFGGCRICLVYDVKMKRSIIACGSYVYDGMEIETENQQVKKDREFILQMLFTRHPLDCPICDKAGECDLQNWGTYWGPQKNLLPITPFEKIRPEEDWESDFLEFVSNRCVLCLKCVSVCDNINKSHSLFPLERGFEMVISPTSKPMDLSSCEMCGLCVDICPVGAILFKPFKFNARPWLLKESYSHCGFCSLNCPVVINHDGKRIYRIRSTADLESCGKVYLGYDSLNTNRLKAPILNGEKISDEKASDILKKVLTSDKTAIFISGYLTSGILEILEKIKQRSFASFTSDISLAIVPLLDGYKRDYKPIDISQIKKFKNIYVVGDDIADTNPVLTYYLPDGIKFVGEKVGPIKKLNPDVIELDSEGILNFLSGIEDDSLIVYSHLFYGEYAYRFGKILRELEDKKSCKVLIAPPQTNAFGVINRFSDMEYFTRIVEKIIDGSIENIVLFGEEIATLLSDEMFKEIWTKLKFKVLFTPFEDGLSLISNLNIPLTLWTEEESYFDGYRGKMRIKKAINPSFDTSRFLIDLLNLLPELKSPVGKTIGEYKNPDYLTYPKIGLQDVGYFSLRSLNLRKWKEKLLGELIDEN